MIPGDYSLIDNIGIERSEYVWVHHCEFADDPWNVASTPGNRRRYDGLIDITRGSSWISISNSIFRSHNLVSLVGNDENMTTDRGRLKVTWYHNWFQDTVQRHPLIRFGEVHIVKNLYTGITSYGIGVGVGALIYSERNAFIDSRRAWGWPVENWNPGMPAPANANAFYLNVGNLLTNSNHDTNVPSNGVTWRPENYYPFHAMNAGEVNVYVRRHAGKR